jgi:hypothetical protein
MMVSVTVSKITIPHMPYETPNHLSRHLHIYTKITKMQESMFMHYPAAA